MLKHCFLVLALSLSFNSYADMKFVIEGKNKDTLIIKPSEIKSVTMSRDKNDNPQFDIEFDSNSSIKISEFTEKHLKERMSLYIDNTFISSPTIQSPLGGKFRVTGVKEEDSKRLLNHLKGGKSWFDFFSS